MQKKLKMEPNPTQVEYHHTIRLSKTKNFKSGVIVLQSLQKVSEYRLDWETIQFDEHTSIQKKLKIEPNPTQAKHHHTTSQRKPKISNVV